MRDRGRLTGLMTVLVIGQAFIIGSLFSRGPEDEAVIRTTHRAVEQAHEVEEAEKVRVDPGARRRAGRMAALERGLQEARATVRELRGRLDHSEAATDDLRRMAAAEAERRNAELASVRAEQARQGSIALNGLMGSSDGPAVLHYPDGRVLDADGNLIAGSYEVEAGNEPRLQVVTAVAREAIRRHLITVDVRLEEAVPVLNEVVRGRLIEYAPDNNAEGGQVVYSYSFEQGETESAGDR